ncbi:Hsp20/alpha crystallin family protein, partial [bacterium]|nr:Hsp20/alpha crystallin family protein [bacterium]
WDIQNEINKVFNSVMAPFSSEEGELRGAWTPTVDISETENELVVSADLPGLNKEDIKVNVQNNVLTFSGERKQETKSEESNVHRLERSYGFFSRSFTLPATVKADGIKAVYKDGVLRLTLPKVEEAKPRQIAVDVK